VLPKLISPGATIALLNGLAAPRSACVYIFAMYLDRLGAQLQLPSNLSRAKPGTQKVQNVQLTVSQLLSAWARTLGS